MAMRKKFAFFLKNFASKVLDVDDTALPERQLELLSDFLAKYKFNINNGNISEIVSTLKKKHMVDSILVTNKDGSIILSSEGNGMHEAITGAAMLNYINSEMPQSQTVFVKNKGHWFMLLPYNNKVYIVKSSSDLSNIELRALAKELEKFIADKAFAVGRSYTA